MEPLQRIVQQFGVRRLAIVLAGGLTAIALVAFLALRAGTPEMGYLYTDLDPGSAATITERLRTQNIPFQVSPDGTAVMAPADRLAELRMSFAGDQLGGKIGYEVLDAEQPFGTSSSRAKLNERRAIEGELSRSIETLQSVRKARVHVVMPEREVFASEDRPASAAITLVTMGRLSAAQTDAIRYLVAGAVPGLSPERISVVDQSGTLLARIGDDSSGASSLAERQESLETRLRQNVEQILEQLVGPGKARAEVVAELNLAQVREESQTFDPDKQVIARQTALDSNNEANERQDSGDASVGAQLPGAAERTGGDLRRTAGKETSEETVYENSVVRKTAVSQGGDIKRLTVSVMVDRSALRSTAETERLTRLVENAVGYNEERGDKVVVEALPFAAKNGEDAALAEEPFMSSSQIVSLGTNLVLGLLALAAVFVVARAIRERPAAMDAAMMPAGLPGPGMTPEVRDLVARAAGGNQDAIREIASLEDQRGNPPMLDHDIDLAFVSGRMKAATMARVGEVVRENRTEAISVVRQWMQE